MMRRSQTPVNHQRRVTRSTSRRCSAPGLGPPVRPSPTGPQTCGQPRGGSTGSRGRRGEPARLRARMLLALSCPLPQTFASGTTPMRRDSAERGALQFEGHPPNAAVLQDRLELPHLHPTAGKCTEQQGGSVRRRPAPAAGADLAEPAPARQEGSPHTPRWPAHPPTHRHREQLLPAGRHWRQLPLLLGRRGGRCSAAPRRARRRGSLAADLIQHLRKPGLHGMAVVPDRARGVCKRAQARCALDATQQGAPAAGHAATTARQAGTRPSRLSNPCASCFTAAAAAAPTNDEGVRDARDAGGAHQRLRRLAAAVYRHCIVHLISLPGGSAAMATLRGKGAPTRR